MATNFPGSLDSFTNPSASDAMDSVTVPHATQHADLNDAVESLQVKVGVDGSAVTSSLDYKVAQQGLTLVKTQTIGTAVSSVTVTNAFSATFDNYRILVQVDNASNHSRFDISLGSTTTGYYGGHYGYRFNGSVYTSGVANGSASSVGACGAGYGGFSNIDISRPYQSDQTSWNGNFTYIRIDSNNGAFGYFGGMVDDTTSYTSFTLTPSGATWTGGTIRVFGYNNG